MKQNLRHKIYTAALVHDMGKFYQRADIFNKPKKSYFEMLDDKYRQLENIYCRVYNGKYTHKHVLWTAQFVEKVLGINEVQYDTENNSLLHLAASHHNPTDLKTEIITLADHLSSSVDRNQITADIKHEEDWGDYKKTPLLSIFETLGRFDEKKDWKFRLPVGILDTEHIMPVTKENIDDLPSLYAETWKNFEKELKESFRDPSLFLKDKNTVETFYYLLQKYMVNIPSSTQDIPDVSLFDHSKITAAFAVNIFDYLKANKIEDRNRLKALRQDDENRPFILLGGDVSGIQSYLYKIKSKFAAKNLKGRSFMLHLISQSITQKLLDLMDLYQSNIIYNSGGTFFMLLPNTNDVISIIKEFQEDLEKELFEKFGGDIFVALAGVPFSMPDIFNGDLNLIWEQVFEKISKKKSKRFKNLIEENYSQFFEAFGNPDQSQLDSITGAEIKGKVIKLENLTLSELTYKQIELGKKLKKAEYWYMVNGEFKTEFSIDFLGYSHLLLEEEDLRLNHLPDAIRYRFNNTNFISPKSKNIQAFEFYGGNDYPVDEFNEPKTFDRLTRGNYNKLGILRMDVDNLGRVFKTGFAKKQRTFSRYASLSRNLDLFFKAYLNSLWNSIDIYRQHIFILYSGGDDLFIIGDWSVVQDFAERIRQSFREFVCYNPILTISGGNLITPPKYPILKSADMASDLEKLAKNYVHKNKKIKIRHEEKQSNENERIIEIPKEKDAFSFLNTALGWEVEYPMVREKAQEFFDKVKQKQLPKSFLHKIIKYYQQRDEYRTQWLMSYDFKRMSDDLKNEKEYLMQILKDVLNNYWENRPRPEINYRVFKLYALAARWAEIKYRDNKNEDV